MKWVKSAQLRVLGKMEKVQGEGQCKKHFKVIITCNGKMERGDSDNEEILKGNE